MAAKQNDWREVTLSVQPKSVLTYVFPDTKPNHYDINNLSPAELYAGVRVLPSTLEYELNVPSNGRNILARMDGASQIQIYNGSDVPGRFILTTFNAEFNPAVLANNGGGVITGGGGGGVSSEVLVNGFKSALPAGNNNIGQVIVTQMPAVQFVMDTLPTGTNLIGNVGVTKLPPLAEGTSYVGRVGVEGGVSINSMPPVQVTNDPVRGSHFHWESVIGLTKVDCVITGGDVIKFSYIVNEGDTDLFLNFDSNTVDPSNTSGANKTIRLKAGEQLTEFTRKSTKLSFIRLTGTGTVRLLGV